MQAFVTALIVLLAFAHVALRYLPRLRDVVARPTGTGRARAIPAVLSPTPTAGCGSGCGPCKGCPVGTRRAGSQVR